MHPKTNSNNHNPTANTNCQSEGTSKSDSFQSRTLLSKFQRSG